MDDLGVPWFDVRHRIFHIAKFRQFTLEISKNRKPQLTEVNPNMAVFLSIPN
jgi:hypothetical protein